MKKPVIIISGVIMLCLAVMALIRYAGPSIKVSVSLSRNTALVGDKVTYTIRVEADKDMAVQIPDVSGALKIFNIFDEGSSEKEFLLKKLYIKWYVIMPYTADGYVVPAVEIKYKRPDGSSGRIESDNVHLLVKGVAGKEAEKDFTAAIGAGSGEANSRRVDTPIRLKIIDVSNVAGIITVSDILFKISLAIASLLTIYLAIYFIRKWLTAPKILSAYETALRGLAEIDPKKAQSETAVKEFYFRISYIVRNYFKEVFAFGPKELTTKEFLARLYNIPSLADGIKDYTKELVERCDLVKFSGEIPDAGEFKSHRDLAINIIEEVNLFKSRKEADK